MRRILIFSILFVITLGITIPQSYAEWKIEMVPSFEYASEETMPNISYTVPGLEDGEIVCLIQMATSFINDKPYEISGKLKDKPIDNDNIAFITNNKASNFIDIVHVEPEWWGAIDGGATNQSPIMAGFTTQYVLSDSPIRSVYDAATHTNQIFPLISEQYGPDGAQYATQCATAGSNESHFYDRPHLPSIKRIIITDKNSGDADMLEVIGLFTDNADTHSLSHYTLDDDEDDLRELLLGLAEPMDYTKINGMEFEVAALKISPNDTNPKWLESMKWGVLYGEDTPLTIQTDTFNLNYPSCEFFDAAKQWNDSRRLIEIPGIPADLSECTSSPPGSLLTYYHTQLMLGSRDAADDDDQKVPDNDDDQKVPDVPDDPTVPAAPDGDDSDSSLSSESDGGYFLLPTTGPSTSQKDCS